MAHFHNSGTVDSQIGIQNVQGPINYFYDSSQPTSASIRVSDSVKALDNDILASLAFPEMFDRRSNISKPHEGTCQWLFEHQLYKNWTSAPRGLLWIKGKPGAGKSTLMAALYDRIRSDQKADPAIRLDFFFNARGVELQHNALGMLRALMNQLFNRDDRSRSIIRDRFKEKQAAFGAGSRTWQWQQRELESILEQSVLIAAQKPLIIFVDALDEAGSDSAWEIAKYLHRLNDRFASATEIALAKICISCRHFPILSATPKTEIHVEKHNREDIVKFIQSTVTITTMLNDDRLLQSDWEEIVMYMIEKAEGVFQWVHLVLPLVERGIMRGDSPNEVRRWLQRIPKELDQMYEYVIVHTLEPETYDLSLRLFVWVLMSETPLTLDALRYALAAADTAFVPEVVQCDQTSRFIGTEEMMALRVTSLSGGLIETMRRTHDSFYKFSIAQIIHQTVKDYMLTKGLSLLRSLQCDESIISSASRNEGINDSDVGSQCHELLYQSCLNYVLTEDTDPCQQHPRTHGPLDSRLPFMQYAIKYLFVHAEKCNRLFETDIIKQTTLLQTAFSKLSRSYMFFDRKTWPNVIELADGNFLYAVTIAGPTPVIKQLLLNMENIHDLSANGCSPLHVAAVYGRVDVVAILCEMGVDIDKRGDSTIYSRCGKTPLLLATSYGQTEIVKLLLCKGASIDPDLNQGSFRPLTIAAEDDRIEIARALIGAGADVNARDGSFGSALHSATAKGNHQMVRLLLSHKADVNLKSEQNVTPLDLVSVRDIDGVRLLLDAGALPSISSCGPNSECYYSELAKESAVAASESCSKVVRLLLNSGMGDRVGEELLVEEPLAAASLLHHEIAQMLHNASPHQKAIALHEAMLQNQSDAFELLMRQDVDFNARFEGNATLTLLAALDGREDILSRFIDQGADFSTANNLGWTPLHVATLHGMEQTARRMLNMGGHADPVDVIGETPFHIAVRQGSVLLANCLLDHGADPCVPDVYGKLAFEWINSHPMKEQYRAKSKCSVEAVSKPNQMRILSASVVRLAQTIIRVGEWTHYGDYLGRCLTFLGDDENAIIYFNQQFIHPKGLLSGWAAATTCDRCEDIIYSTFYVCRVCPASDYCAKCMGSGRVCRGNHDFLKVASTAASDSALVDTHSSTVLLRETPIRWLEGLIEQYSAPTENRRTVSIEVNEKNEPSADPFEVSNIVCQPIDSTEDATRTTSATVHPVTLGFTPPRLGLRSAWFTRKLGPGSYLINAPQMISQVHGSDMAEVSDLD